MPVWLPHWWLYPASQVDWTRTPCFLQSLQCFRLPRRPPLHGSRESRTHRFLYTSQYWDYYIYLHSQFRRSNSDENGVEFDREQSTMWLFLYVLLYHYYSLKLKHKIYIHIVVACSPKLRLGLFSSYILYIYTNWFVILDCFWNSFWADDFCSWSILVNCFIYMILSIGVISFGLLLFLLSAIIFFTNIFENKIWSFCCGGKLK